MRTEARVEIVSSLACVEAEDWNRLAGSQPFLRHAYLYGLEQAGCVGGASGWAPCHVLLYRSGELIGALPLYLKHHSYGEYVFDWAWAEAYARQIAEQDGPALVSPFDDPKVIAVQGVDDDGQEVAFAGQQAGKPVGADEAHDGLVAGRVAVGAVGKAKDLPGGLVDRGDHKRRRPAGHGAEPNQAHAPVGKPCTDFIGQIGGDQ